MLQHNLLMQALTQFPILHQRQICGQAASLRSPMNCLQHGLQAVAAPEEGFHGRCMGMCRQVDREGSFWRTWQHFSQLQEAQTTQRSASVVMHVDRRPFMKCHLLITKAAYISCKIDNQCALHGTQSLHTHTFSKQLLLACIVRLSRGTPPHWCQRLSELSSYTY